MQLKANITQSASTYVAESRFKIAPQKWTITLILAQSYSQNGFYEKHVLRQGELPATVAAQRKSDTGNNYYGVQGLNINHSTFILLDRINIKAMVYAMCKTVLANHLAGHLPAVGGYIADFPIEAVFDEANSVVTIHQAGPATSCRSIKLGGYLRALNAATNELTFEINHSGGQGAT